MAPCPHADPRPKRTLGVDVLPSKLVPSFLHHVAENVRARRLAAGLSQQALAEVARVSLRVLGGIERGTARVSTATLDRIGVALDATLSDLVADPQLALKSRPDRLVWRGDRGGHGTLKTSVPARRAVELWDWTLCPGERYAAAADPAGWHIMLIVITGRLQLEREGVVRSLRRGSHVFASDTDHAYVNTTRQAIRFFSCSIW
jgi:transcriptional regulator with XRE-family HTH domain